MIPFKKQSNNVEVFVRARSVDALDEVSDGDFTKIIIGKHELVVLGSPTEIEEDLSQDIDVENLERLKDGLEQVALQCARYLESTPRLDNSAHGFAERIGRLALEALGHDDVDIRRSADVEEALGT